MSAFESVGLPITNLVATFGRSGTLVATPGAGRYLFPSNATIVGVTAAVNTAPVGSSIICDVNKNGTTVFTTQANRPEIAAGEYQTLASAVPDITSLVAGDYLTVDIDDVGSSTPGSDLTVQVLYHFL